MDKSTSLKKERKVFVIPGNSDNEESACNVGDLGSIPGLGPGEGNGYPLQYSCLENPKDRNLASYSLWSLKESDTTERLKVFLLLCSWSTDLN